MVKGWSTSLNVYFIHGTFINVMLKSYLVYMLGVTTLVQLMKNLVVVIIYDFL